MNIKFCVVTTFLAIMLTSPALCANTINPTDPAIINKDNQIQLRDSFIEEKIVQPVEYGTRMKDSLDKQKQQEKDLEKADKTTLEANLTYNPEFVLKKVTFQGNTKISTKQLNKLAENIIGKDIHLEDIMELTIKVSRYYQSKGYITSYAYLPAQEIENGNVLIVIKESKIVSKEVEGNRWERVWYFNNVATYGLAKDKVFNARDLQGAMKNMNNKPHMRVAASISKNEDHDTEIKLHVQDRLPLTLNLAWDDYGRNYTGRQRFTSVLGFENFLGFGDKIYGGSILSQDSTGALAGYSIPISKYGTRLAFDYSYSHVNLGGPYRSLGLTGDATSYSLRITQPIKSTATQDIAAYVSFDAINSTSKSQLFRENLSDYKLRVLRTGVNGMFDDSKGRTIANFGVDIGTNGLGASENIYNGQQSTFYKVVASLARVQRLPKKCIGIVRINGQYSPQSLYSAEQMYLGGVYSIRGYQPSELLGDYGVAGSFELRTPIPGLEKILPNKVKHWSNNIKLAAFYDWGYVKEHNNLYGYPQNFLHSVGVGTYINLTDAIYVQVGVGIPLGKKYYNEENARMYFAINTDIDKILLKPKERL